MKKNTYIIIFGLAAWVLLVGLGWSLLSRYENTPGHSAITPEGWPSNTQILKTPGFPTLVMFVHPHCPCTRASIGELNAIMASCGKHVNASLLFIKPSEFNDAWVKSDLWKKASRIPGVVAIQDSEGKEAKIFHATTSGQVLLYDRSGRLVFNGGITGSRGHSGNNVGRQSVTSFLLKGSSGKRQTFVYGCSLFTAECKFST